MSAVPPNGCNIHLNPVVEISESHHTTRYKNRYPVTKTKISADIPQQGSQKKVAASLSFKDYFGKSTRWHRVIKAKNLDTSSEIGKMFFMTLGHVKSIVPQDKEAQIEKKQTLKKPLTIDESKITFSEKKKRSDGTVKLVAKSSLIKGCKIEVCQDKDGTTTITASEKNYLKLLKAMDHKKDKHLSAVFALIQERAIRECTKFRKENA